MMEKLSNTDVEAVIQAAMQLGESGSISILGKAKLYSAIAGIYVAIAVAEDAIQTVSGVGSNDLNKMMAEKSA